MFALNQSFECSINVQSMIRCF